MRIETPPSALQLPHHIQLSSNIIIGCGLKRDTDPKTQSCWGTFIQYNNRMWIEIKLRQLENIAVSYFTTHKYS